MLGRRQQVLIRKILFAVDLGPNSRAAIPAVTRLAHDTGSEVVLLYIRDPAASKAFCRPLEGIAARFEEAGVRAVIEIRAAPVAEVAIKILAAAKFDHADLIALGSRGRSDLRGMFAGSVSHSVIAHSDCPVLVVRRGSRRLDGPIERILLAVAGGPEVPHAVGLASGLARITGARVLVLHARYLVAANERPPILATAEEPAETVRKILRRLSRAGIKAEAYEPLAIGGVARAIAREARIWDADLVVVGSRRLSDFASFFLGGIDHQLMQLSDRPVVVAERADPLVPAHRP
jgi:nucleotide-binding universal stress UspA family protein